MMPMGTALQLTVFIEECDTWHHRPLSAEIVHRAHEAGLAGATVLRGVGGFGASSVIHGPRLLSIKQDLPLAIIIVDDEERIRRFVPVLRELVEEGLVIVERIDVMRRADQGPVQAHA
jgi:PII-like signaling protein